MPTKRLLVNADDFGFGEGSTQATLDAIGAGHFINSVSVMTNFAAAARVEEIRRTLPHVSIGIHLNPLDGHPICPVERIPSMVDRNGEMHGDRFPALLLCGRIRPRELEIELDAQMESGRSLAGSSLTHVDSHGNCNVFYFGLFVRLARRHGVPCVRNNGSEICLEADNHAGCKRRAYLSRPHMFLAHRYRRMQMHAARRSGLKMTDRLVTVGYGGGRKTEAETWKQILRNLPDGTSEIYCHPAYPDETIRKYSRQLDDRREEFAIVSSPMLAQFAADCGIELISYHHLLKP